MLEVSRLQAKVDRLVDRGLSQTDPRVIAASEAVDKLVVEKMRQRAADAVFCHRNHPDVSTGVSAMAYLAAGFLIR